MTLALSLITLVSLATTGALIIYVARLVREERERSEARVAALSSAIRDRGPEGGASPATPASRSLARPITEPERSPWLPGSASLLFAGRTDDTGLTASRRWIVPGAAVAAVAAALLLLAVTTSDRRTPSAPASAAAEGTAQPLELLSLRHSREDSSLTVSGLVRNPPDAPPHVNTDVVVFTFDEAGGSLSSVRAALADAELGGGAESPFSLTIPDGARVHRYRVSFRRGSRVLPHVDRRGDARAMHPAG